MYEFIEMKNIRDYAKILGVFQIFQILNLVLKLFL